MVLVPNVLLALAGFWFTLYPSVAAAWAQEENILGTRVFRIGGPRLFESLN